MKNFLCQQFNLWIVLSLFLCGVFLGAEYPGTWFGLVAGFVLLAVRSIDLKWHFWTTAFIAGVVLISIFTFTSTMSHFMAANTILLCMLCLGVDEFAARAGFGPKSLVPQR
jgi:hypothetical protein